MTDAFTYEYTLTSHIAKTYDNSGIVIFSVVLVKLVVKHCILILVGDLNRLDVRQYYNIIYVTESFDTTQLIVSNFY